MLLLGFGFVTFEADGVAEKVTQIHYHQLCDKTVCPAPPLPSPPWILGLDYHSSLPKNDFLLWLPRNAAALNNAHHNPNNGVHYMK